MGNRKIVRSCFVFIICCSLSFALAGCGMLHKSEKTTESTGTTVTTTESRNVVVLPPVTESTSDSKENPDQTGITQGVTEPVIEAFRLPIYTMNPDTLETEAVTVLIQATEITPQLIIDAVLETLEDHGYTIPIESVTTQGDAVVVSFYSGKPPLTFGSSVEGTILNVFAQSLVDNLDDYSKVIYRLEGKAYSSGHFEFGINEVFLEDTTK